MYTKGFFLDTPVGNNAFSFVQRKNKKLWIPSVKEITKLDDIKLQSDKNKIAFEDFGFDDKLSTNYGLENFYRISCSEKEIILFDNHNHAFYFWYEARNKGIIGNNCTLIHIDEHADTRDNNKHISKTDSQDLQKVFDFTNYTLNVGDYIIPAKQEGIIERIIQVRNTQNLEDYMTERETLKGDIILNLDLDFFQPDLDFIDYKLKKQVVLDAFKRAKIVTVCTSPFFIEQELAVKVFTEIFSEVL